MRQIFILIAVVFLAPASSAAQTATLTGTVSETVALSVTRITLSGDDAQPSVIRVPLLVRSNSSFKISAESQTAELSQLMVTDVHATGNLVSPEAVHGLNVPRKFNLDSSRLIATGPRVSLGGTLNSPNNALQITLLIRLNSQPSPGSPVQLTFVATAGSPVQ
jgi:hypothetical protein